MSQTHRPTQVDQVMISSTFTDLKEHRAALIGAIHGYGLHACAMENDSAKIVDVIQSSLGMVRKSAAYICLIGFKYGQTPTCPQHNPDERSITELEFDEALRQNRPILLFLIGKSHPIVIDDVEPDSAKKAKLEAFRERAKQIGPDSKVHRVYAEFSDLSDFERKIGPSIAELDRYLRSASSSAKAVDTDPKPSAEMLPGTTAPSRIPRPPALYAKPDYLPGHEFIGRKAQREELNDWASADNPAHLLLFHAIGGNGKSMLTWQWATRHAPQVRQDWAGRFWYSFYEQGAVMADFCRHALAYMTGRRLEEFKTLKTLQMRDELLAHLKAKPWLLILDGLERVLVAYHRIDAAELADEASDNPTDVMAGRNPRDTIRDEDGDLLRALAQAAPSKILVTSRLIPRVLLNAAGQDIPGAKCKPLDGLLAEDAELLFQACGIQGDSAAIRSYLGKNCDNHPLVIGVIAGLVNDYLPDRGNFDAWVADPEHGAKLDLGHLDLIQRRNHILKAAIAALPADSAAVLSQLALLQEAVDYPTLQALNPLLPPVVEMPDDPKAEHFWDALPQEMRGRMLEEYAARLVRYQDAQSAWADPDVQRAPQRLAAAIQDLERRGLLQYESKRHDLHPVVRSVAFAEASPEQRLSQGERAVDHFSSRPHRPYEHVETLEEMAPALHAIRVCLKLGMTERAVSIYVGDVAIALQANLEAYYEILEILRPLFPDGWGKKPAVQSERDASFIATDAGNALSMLGNSSDAENAYGMAISYDLAMGDFDNTQTMILAFASLSADRNALYKVLILSQLAYSLAMADREDAARLFVSANELDLIQAKLGFWEDLAVPKIKSDVQPPSHIRALYRLGNLEFYEACLTFWRNENPRPQIARALPLAREGQNRNAIRGLHQLEGAWHAKQQEWPQAFEAYDEALRLARERNLRDAESETGLALAKYHLGALPDAREHAERLAQLREPAHYRLAQLWKAIGDLTQARHHARASYKESWGDGEPYVFRYALDRTIELLHTLNEPIPQLPPFDPARVHSYPWEAQVQALVDRLNTEKAAKAAAHEDAEPTTKH